MKKIKLGTSPLYTGEIGLGCMRMNDLDLNEAEGVVKNALNLGVDLFDHADIYGKGKSEEIFGKAVDLKSSIRDKMILQSKCGIREGYFDFSKKHIISSVEESLKRLGSENLDVLLLHRPDALMEPEEVAAAFTELKKSGKVKYFGVSNQHPQQIELLQSVYDEDLIINQLQLSLMHTPMLDHGFNVNMKNDAAINRDGGVYEYSRMKNMTIQAWSPFQHGMIEGAFIGNKNFPEVNAKLDEIAEKKNVTSGAAAIAWLLKLPAGIQPVVGTMKQKRLQDIAEASNIEITRAEWYELYRAAGNKLP
ncbi:aldo/keto reductase [Alkalicoccus halolimnae]|uniref:Aldo/keto reductase n=1 Tax=Alkalicoccus halolimnae TaxID=1667239 RepID=A0A5C7F2U7_9BACI|nr:aldo/keto reductase [Alkalicoccus halolimnae]TXF81323.1 aldo/keto reductase family oxidoreductase [Alkalicoccus halolimnae]